MFPTPFREVRPKKPPIFPPELSGLPKKVGELLRGFSAKEMAVQLRRQMEPHTSQV